MANKKEYEQAKNIVDKLELGKQELLKIKNLPYFRKYLSELSKGKVFTTRLHENQLIVIRLK